MSRYSPLVEAVESSDSIHFGRINCTSFEDSSMDEKRNGNKLKRWTGMRCEMIFLTLLTTRCQTPYIYLTLLPPVYCVIALRLNIPPAPFLREAEFIEIMPYQRGQSRPVTSFGPSDAQLSRRSETAKPCHMRG